MCRPSLKLGFGMRKQLQPWASAAQADSTVAMVCQKLAIGCSSVGETSSCLSRLVIVASSGIVHEARWPNTSWLDTVSDSASLNGLGNGRFQQEFQCDTWNSA